ncbi:MAG: hypothetical protein PHZ07_05120 [Patescibacteria group bacterium]|nr:hypothetical protein [Patescibacteria group bacterium]MDD4304873.1 hypothetical protein [Patescibacteria group bacterium]MDD4695779.1 hypothetical protein [Patescibacteria group bacterium]
MQIQIAFDPVVKLINTNPFILPYTLFIKGGWLLFIIIFFWIYYKTAYLEKLQRKFLSKVEYTLFAIDIPKNNEQTVRAVEELFNSLHGIKSGATNWEKYILGATQLWFSLEIVSLEGYIQFLIRTPSKFKDTIRSSIYAYYPDAEVTEVEDYISLIPLDANQKESKYKAFGMDYYLEKKDYYPLKTYINFEHSMTQTFIDPLASTLEIMSKIGSGEFIGLMIITRPVGNDDVKKPGETEVSDIMGKQKAQVETWADKVSNTILKGIDKGSEAIYSIWGDIEESDDKKSELKMLTPGERITVSNIENKIGKLIFETKLRVCYVAPKDRFNAGTGYYGMQGALKQFNGDNALKANKTNADYFRVESRTRNKVRKFLKRFVERSVFDTKSFLISSEELATLYHFPDQNVKTPLLKKTETKTVEPPTSLPMENMFESELMKERDEKNKQSQIIQQKIKNKEVIDLDLDNKQFEAKFAKDKNQREEFKKEIKKEEELKKIPNNLPIPDEQIYKEKMKDTPKPPDNLPFVQ